MTTLIWSLIFEYIRNLRILWIYLLLAPLNIQVLWYQNITLSLQGVFTISLHMLFQSYKFWNKKIIAKETNQSNPIYIQIKIFFFLWIFQLALWKRQFIIFFFTEISYWYFYFFKLFIHFRMVHFRFRIVLRLLFINLGNIQKSKFIRI